MTMTSFEMAKAIACDGAVSVRDSLRPDEDWDPIAILVAQDPPTIIPVVFAGLPEDRDGKDMMAAALASVVAEEHPEAVAMVASAWMVLRTDEQLAAAFDDFDASEQPDRFEIVSVVVVDRDQATGLWARVTRHPDEAPTLGGWEEPGDGDAEAVHEGRWVEAIRAGLEAS